MLTATEQPRRAVDLNRSHVCSRWLNSGPSRVAGGQPGVREPAIAADGAVMKDDRVWGMSRIRRASVAWAALLAVVVTTLRLVFPHPNLGISFLFVAPVVLIAIAYGVRGAACGTAISVLLTFVTSAATGVSLDVADYLVRSAVIAFVGVVAAVFTDMNRKLEVETAVWFEQDIDLHCIASADGRFLRVNEAFVRTLGYSRDELLSKPFIDFVHPDDQKKTIAETSMLAHGLGNSVDFENRYLAKDGTYRWLRWSGTPADDGRIYASARDVTTQIELQRQLERLATTDPLTGLLNRRAFEQEAERVLKHIARHGSCAAVLMLDLDGFKAVNDRVGHHAGDEVLMSVAGALRSRLRSTDLLARVGGDEFMMLLPEVAMPDAGICAGQLLDQVQTCGWSEEGFDLPIAGSIGMALFEADSGSSLTELLRRADLSMYEAKARGGGQYSVDGMEIAVGRQTG
jgi:diguanylate cyclase (GGDEF)-like protein/PAS domain S-box-containing protein